MRRKRILGVAVALAVVGASAFVISLKSRRSSPSPKISSREDFFSPLGPADAVVRVEVYLPFDSVCPSCVLEARKVFEKILKRHPGKVRFEFVDMGSPQEIGPEEKKPLAEVKEELAKTLKRQGVFPDPNAEAWLLVNGRAKFRVEGQTVVLKRLPRPSDKTAHLLRRIIDEEVRRRYK